MSLSIELRTVWHLWPLVAWEWFYCGYEFCEHCARYESGHMLRREITVTVWLPFAALTFAPGYGFKTRTAIEGCPNKPRAVVDSEALQKVSR